jgi:hypothetical protein
MADSNDPARLDPARDWDKALADTLPSASKVIPLKKPFALSLRK